jgi:cysteine desulfurase
MVAVAGFKHFVSEGLAEESGTGMGERAYLDHNATSPLRPAVADAMTRALALVGNPSSIHAEGRLARAAVENARRQVAAAVGAEPRNVVFTSGATEALNTLLRTSPSIETASARVARIVRGATEHDAVIGASGSEAEILDVDADGLVAIDGLSERLAPRGDGVAMLALQLANGETGVVQPIDRIAAVARSAEALMVGDAVAACGKMAIHIRDLGVDALVLSAHKFGGPKGAGAIVINGDRLRIAEPLLRGGGQEQRRRSGTENVAAIVGMGAAVEEATAGLSAEAERQRGLRDRLLDGLRAVRPDLVVFGENAPRLPNTLNVGVQGLRSETAVMAFDLAGVAISAGSACSSGKVKRSHVLGAMGVAPDLADGALRFSLGWTSTEADIGKAIEVFRAVASHEARRAA